MTTRFVHITPRLEAALRMLEGYSTVADIGCDHGRLTAALLQRRMCERVIATDISEPSLEKAKSLIRYIGLEDRVSFRVGDGCSVLSVNECDAIAVLGMGGTLMSCILNDCPVPLIGANAVVLQPMRAQDDIRAYLYRHRFHITDDLVVFDHGRYYQVFKAIPTDSFEQIPDGFPEGFFDVGYRSFEQRDPLLPNLCRQQLLSHESMLRFAAGSSGSENLQRKIRALKQILDAFDYGGTE